MNAVVTKKMYFCPICGREEYKETNHFGDGVGSCRKGCGCNTLFCGESEANEARKQYAAKSVFIHPYYLRTDDYEENEQYKAIRAKLEAAGTPVWEEQIVWAEPDNKPHCRAVNHYLSDGSIILVKVWNNDWNHQFITNKGRMWTWHETSYPNPRIKEGYYLTDLEGNILTGNEGQL